MQNMLDLLPRKFRFFSNIKHVKVLLYLIPCFEQRGYRRKSALTEHIFKGRRQDKLRTVYYCMLDNDTHEGEKLK